MDLQNFIPEWLSNFFTRNTRGLNSYALGQTGPVWINTREPYNLYNAIPDLKTVVDRKCSMFSNMAILKQDIRTGEIVEDVELQKLIENPNITQSMNSWLRQYKLQEQIYGNQFIYKNKPSRLSKYPTALWNVSARYVKPQLTGKLFDQTEMNGVISGYEYVEMGMTRTFNTEDVLFTKLNDIDNPIIGQSPIEALKYPLSNIDAAYEYLNVISAKKGAIGMISSEGNKDSMGSLPMTDEQKAEIENGYTNSYGISNSQRKVMLTSAQVKWTPFSYPTKDLLLLEQMDTYKQVIVDFFGLNINIFSSKSSTYENVKNSILLCYQDTIIPEADQFMQSLTPFIGVEAGFRLVASYDHLTIMKESKLKGMAALQQIVATLDQAVTGGLLDGQKAIDILSNELGLA